MALTSRFFVCQWIFFALTVACCYSAPLNETEPKRSDSQQNPSDTVQATESSLATLSNSSFVRKFASISNFTLEEKNSADRLDSYNDLTICSSFIVVQEHAIKVKLKMFEEIFYYERHRAHCGGVWCSKKK